MDEEQRGESLLAVERLEDAAVDLAVDEVQTDRLATSDRAHQDLDEVPANLPGDGVRPALGEVALDEGDLDPLDAASIAERLLEHVEVGGEVPLHDVASSSASR